MTPKNVRPSSRKLCTFQEFLLRLAFLFVFLSLLPFPRAAGVCNAKISFNQHKEITSTRMTSSHHVDQSVFTVFCQTVAG